MCPRHWACFLHDKQDLIRAALRVTKKCPPSQQVTLLLFLPIHFGLDFPSLHRQIASICGLKYNGWAWWSQLTALNYILGTKVQFQEELPDVSWLAMCLLYYCSPLASESPKRLQKQAKGRAVFILQGVMSKSHKTFLLVFEAEHESY